MRGDIPRVENETYFSSHLDSSGHGTGVHSVSRVELGCVLM